MERIGRGCTGLQAGEGVVRIVAEGAVTVVDDLAFGAGRVDREAVGVADIEIGIGRRDRIAGPFSCALAVRSCATGASFAPVMVTVTVAVDEAPEPSVTV